MLPRWRLLTNRAVIAVNQASTDNQPHFMEDGTRLWSARPQGSRDRYLALFNTSAKARDIALDPALLGLAGPVRVRDLWSGEETGVHPGRFARRIAPHGAGLYRLAV